MLNQRRITYFLLEGTLIGAYRHGGPLPCDGDMDIVFPVWLNGIAVCSDAAGKLPILRGDESVEEALTLCNKTRREYVLDVQTWLQRRFPLAGSAAQVMDWGGIRLTFAGNSLDCCTK